jgi:exopolysaccharide biosynthesis polyprenyl glycosylphosphotransferase
MSSSFIFALGINFNDPWQQIEMRINLSNVILCSILLTTGHYIFKYLGAYDSKRFSTFKKEMVTCFKAVAINSIILASTKTLFSSSLITMEVVITYFVMSLISLLTIRAFLFTLFKFARMSGRNLRNILIAGTNERALILSRSLPKLGYVVKGFIDKEGPYKSSIKVIMDFKTYLRENPIDEVIICLPMKTEYAFIQDIISVTEEQGILTRLSTDLFELKIAKSKVEYFYGEPLLTLFTGNMYRRMTMLKDAFDIIASSFIFIATLPIFIVTSLAIKLTSKGPVFFLQERLGKNKKLFKVLKFRTMISTAEEKLKELEQLNERQGEATFKIKNDPRTTPVGKMLRKLSIDELPQLLNVIKGDMSLVGPRPLPVRDYKGFNLDRHRRRFSVKPGITCIWQISGRDEIPFDEWMRMDNEYIDTWSLWLDFKILTKTLPAVLRGKGAS